MPLVSRFMAKVYGEGEWKVKKHGTDGKRRVWRKLYLAVDISTHEIVAAELSLSNVSDAEVLPNLLKQTRRKIIEISGDGAYDTRHCHDAIRISSHQGKDLPSGNKDILAI